VSSNGDQLQDLKDVGAHVRFLNYLDLVNWLSSETAERIVKQLLDHGACPNQGDGSGRDQGWTPLQLAVNIKNRDVANLPLATKAFVIGDFKPIPLLSAIPAYELQQIGRMPEDDTDRGFEKVAMLLEEHSSRHPLTNWTRYRPCRSCATRVFKAPRSSTKS
jgi:ankyrin repeat protein